MKIFNRLFVCLCVVLTLALASCSKDDKSQGAGAAGQASGSTAAQVNSPTPAPPAPPQPAGPDCVPQPPRDGFPFYGCNEPAPVLGAQCPGASDAEIDAWADGAPSCSKDGAK